MLVDKLLEDAKVIFFQPIIESEFQQVVEKIALDKYLGLDGFIIELYTKY